MRSKYLEGIRYINLENEVISIEYYLLETENNFNTEYGVEIVKRQKSNNQNILVEKNSAKNITYSKENIEKIINKLIGYSVTPISLTNVLEDMLAVECY